MSLSVTRLAATRLLSRPAPVTLARPERNSRARRLDPDRERSRARSKAIEEVRAQSGR